jgi:hypothetical protein
VLVLFAGSIAKKPRGTILLNELFEKLEMRSRYLGGFVTDTRLVFLLYNVAYILPLIVLLRCVISKGLR